MKLATLLLLMTTLAALATCDPGRLSPSLLWKRLGLNRAIGGPQISSMKKTGQSTVYFIKLPPQPHYYIPSNYFAPEPSRDDPADPFEKVSVDFTANGKPEKLYHWNLPLGLTAPTTSSTTPTPTAPTTTTTSATPTRESTAPVKTKKPFKKNFYYNGKPSKVYLVKPARQPYKNKVRY